MKRAAIFYHGFLTDDKDFGRLYENIDKYYDKVEKVVFPGHKKPNDFELFNKEETLDLALSTFDRLKQEGYDKIDLYGFSMGGAIATHVSKLRSVDRLCLYAPANKYLNLTFVFSQFKFQIRTIRNAMMGKSRENAKEALDSIKVYFKNDRAGWKLAMKQLFPNYNFHTLTTFMSIINECNKNLDEISIPTLILWGELDQFVPKNSVEYLEEKCKYNNVHVKIYDDLSHLMFYSENDTEIIEDTIEFLEATK